ncbi:MAG: DNA polymerase III subunit gamma/tau [Defluviitaleaceae bacterium]|nr:DNA polymerase III subunit gamma/tau [Defluviitaleaceae bacterium]
MSYTALYRKLRPSFFEDVVGQEHIVTTLKNQIESGRISHAYLFCGTRGTGKTSTAKIFAKAINCESCENGEACGICLSCESVSSGKSMNVIEIDAASNNGVDNIRDIRDEVKYVPSEGKYKIYIIDEVHMLSTGAFNALLKTLEEPPGHVIFILATTDPQKIPPTIHSRCQRYDFKRISQKEMSDAIKGYMTEENIQITGDALEYITRISDGAMRDALSIIDQLSAFYYGEEITLEKALKSTGGSDKGVLFELVTKFNNRQTAECLEIIKNLIADGRDLNRLVNELLEHFRDMLVSISVNGVTAALDYTPEYIEKLNLQGNLIGREVLIYYIDIFSGIQSAVKYSPNPRILLEVACIKICNPQADASMDSLFAKIKALEDRLENGSIINIGQIQADESELQAYAVEPKSPKPPKAVENKAEGSTSNQAISSEPKAVKVKNEEPAAKKISAQKKIETGNTANAAANWAEFVTQFKEANKNAVVRKFADKSTATSLDESTLYIVTPDSIYNMRSIANGEKLILEAAKTFFGGGFEIQFISESEYDKRYAAIHGTKPDKRYDFEDILNFRIEFVE